MPMNILEATTHPAKAGVIDVGQPIRSISATSAAF